MSKDSYVGEPNQETLAMTGICPADLDVVKETQTMMAALSTKLPETLKIINAAMPGVANEEMVMESVQGIEYLLRIGENIVFAILMKEGKIE